MSVLGVARTDFLRARRTRLVRAIAVLLTLFVGLTFFGVGVSGHTPMSRAYQVQQFFGILLFPLLAVGAAYLAVAGERESGNVQYLLSLPNSRSDVVFGKLVSRLAVTGGAALLAYLVGTAVVALVVAEWSLASQATFVGFTVLYLCSFAGIAVGISAATGSSARAIAGSVAVYFAGSLLWIFGPNATRPPYVVEWLVGLVGVDLSARAVDLLWLLGPTGAYTRGVGLAVPDNPLDPITAGEWFLSPAFAVVVLVGWAVLPAALGYLRFRRADLG